MKLLIFCDKRNMDYFLNLDLNLFSPGTNAAAYISTPCSNNPRRIQSLSFREVPILEIVRSITKNNGPAMRG